MRICLNDCFVMYVHHYAAVLESLHGVAENILGNCLHYIFHELGPVAFNTLQFLGSSDTFTGNTLTAKLVHADVGLYVGELSAGGYGDEQHAAFEGEGKPVCFGGGSFTYCFHYGTIDSPLEFNDIRICVSPCGNKWLKFFLFESHLQGSHGFSLQAGTEVQEYDDALGRRLVETITVYDDRFKVKFKSGIEIEIAA